MTGDDCATDPGATVSIFSETLRYDDNSEYTIRFEDVFSTLIEPETHVYFCITGLTTPNVIDSYSHTLSIWQKDILDVY